MPELEIPDPPPQPPYPHVSGRYRDLPFEELPTPIKIRVLRKASQEAQD